MIILKDKIIENQELRAMELRHLKYFISVCENLNFTKAAIELYTSQPSLSVQIRDLETYLGVKLFFRTKQKVSLTPEGVIFYKSAKAILEQTQIAVDQVRNSTKNQIDIGFVPVAELKILPFILPKLSEINTAKEINLISLNEQVISQKLHNGLLDVAITRTPFQNDLYQCDLILNEPLIFIYPQNIYSFNKKILHLEHLNNIDFIMCDESVSPHLYKKINQYFEKNNIDINIISTANNILLNLNSVSMGLGCTILPAYCLDLPIPNIGYKSLSPELPNIDLYLIYRKNTNNNVQKIFVDRIKKNYHINFD